MPRYFVYVNTHSDSEHVMIHPEKTKACSHIFVHTQQGGINTGNFVIKQLAPDTFKTAEKDNSYWLIVWAVDLASVNSNQFVKRAVANLSKPSLFNPCSKCS